MATDRVFLTGASGFVGAHILRELLAAGYAVRALVRSAKAAPGAPPVALYDGIAICKLLEEIDVAVVKTRFTVAIPDLDLLEILRG